MKDHHRCRRRRRCRDSLRTRLLLKCCRLSKYREKDKVVSNVEAMSLFVAKNNLISSPLATRTRSSVLAPGEGIIHRPSSDVVDKNQTSSSLGGVGALHGESFKMCILVSRHTDDNERSEDSHHWIFITFAGGTLKTYSLL